VLDANGVDAVLARRVQDVTLYACVLTPACAPSLGAPAGRRRRAHGAHRFRACCSPAEGAALLDAPSTALLRDALRASATLTNLPLLGCDVLGGDVLAAVMLLLSSLVVAQRTPACACFRFRIVSVGPRRARRAARRRGAARARGRQRAGAAQHLGWFCACSRRRC
jgi:hypothetical protein